MNIATLVNAAKLAGSKRFNLSCNLKEFPVEIFDLADTLEILDLSGNQFSALPDDFWRFQKLRILFCSNNHFTRLPEVLGQCPQLSMVGFKSNKIRSVPAASLNKSLRWLILTDNQITELPAEIGHCTALQKLMLSGNQLQSLPAELSNCTKLELIRIAANRFLKLPECVNNLPRLSWLAFAGNPVCESFEVIALQQSSMAKIPWQKLSMQHTLGEGTSGVIYQAMLTHETECEMHVAVKLFKGNMTSDGLPHNEMAACMSAGNHPNLIPVHGQIFDHPDASAGLVMSVIAPNFFNLAGPPSLDSCTRDIYIGDTQFTLYQVLRIAHGIASAAQQLHAQGIMHGDLYAHNILHNADGECFLGDFGAATFFSLAEQANAIALQHIEVRAFGCLLEELLARCNATDDKQNVLTALKILQLQCLDANSEIRPLFSDLTRSLSAFQAAM